MIPIFTTISIQFPPLNYYSSIILPLSKSPKIYAISHSKKRKEKIMICGNRSRKGLKICCGVTAILLITFIVVMVILYFTILKPKNPEITSQPVVLEHFELMVLPALKLNVSLGIVVTVTNRNYGGFEYQNSTAYVTYRGDVVAEAPIQADTIPTRREHNISC